MGQHRFSGWPGAYCLLCHAEDALENAMALSWYNPCDDTWDTEEHRLEIVKAQNNCPYTDGLDPYTVELVDGKPVVKKSLFKDSLKDCKATMDEDCKATMDEDDDGPI